MMYTRPMFHVRGARFTPSVYSMTEVLSIQRGFVDTERFVETISRGGRVIVGSANPWPPQRQCLWSYMGLHIHHF
jgi:hypothetical protein